VDLKSRKSYWHSCKTIYKSLYDVFQNAEMASLSTLKTNISFDMKQNQGKLHVYITIPERYIITLTMMTDLIPRGHYEMASFFRSTKNPVLFTSGYNKIVLSRELRPDVIVLSRELIPDVIVLSKELRPDVIVLS